MRRDAGPPAAAGPQLSHLPAAQAEAAASSDEPAPAADTAEQRNSDPAAPADPEPAASVVPVRHYDKGSGGT